MTKLKKGVKMLYQNSEVVIEHDREDGRVNIKIGDGYEVVKIDDLSPVTKKKQPISKQSEKRAGENKEYLKLREVFLSAHPRCEIKVPGCTVKSTEVHHAGGRIGKRLTQVELFIAACSSCHRYLEVNPAWAKENGYSVNRL